MISNITNTDRKGYHSMRTLHLNSQVQRYDGLTPGQRVFGRSPRMPSGAVGDPNFADFTNHVMAPETQTRE